MPKAPLHGVRVLDLSRLLPGPFCSLILSELGADVVKVEDQQAGDYMRIFPPQKGGVGGAYYALNRGKRSISVDLKKPAGRQLLLRLLPQYQVVLESFRPGVMERLGLGYDALAEVHPDVILCSITGYGQDGPLRDRAGHDMNYLALSGVLAAGGAAGGPPALPGIQVADIAGGALWAAIRILAALHSGGGAHLDVSMTEGVMSFMLPWLSEFAFSSKPYRRGEEALNGGRACYQPYPTGDGRYLGVAALEPKFWSALCKELGLDHGPADAMAPPQQQREMEEELGRRFAQHDLAHWRERLAGVDACVEPVLEMEELASHPQHQHRQSFYTLEDPLRGPVQQLRLPLEGEPAQTPAPLLGEHTDEVLAEASFSDEEIQRLRQTKVIR